MIGLYFHVPFCSRKCDYCHFYVLPDKEALKEQYMQSLKQEWALRLPLITSKPIGTIYFGGGTPALLGPKRVEQILGWIHQFCDLSDQAEITLEANPENITLELMQAYESTGINRLSIGIQALQDSLLVSLGRHHASHLAMESVHTASHAGFENISIDLMYDLPNQQLVDWEMTLNEAVKLPITHLSLYNLTIEPHTVFFKKQELLKPKLPNPDTSLTMYELALQRLEEAGLKRYEISAFAKEGFHAKHNTGYWTGRPFIGFGPSAFSYWEGKRFRNIANINRYSRLLAENGSPVDFEEELDPSAKRRELLAVQLRLTEGVHLEEFQQKQGPLEKETWEALQSLEKQNLISITTDYLKLTHRGMLFYDMIASEII
jgi:oxygen-independent coproporphyrinogen-3 oxidase